MGGEKGGEALRKEGLESGVRVEEEYPYWMNTGGELSRRRGVHRFQDSHLFFKAGKGQSVSSFQSPSKKEVLYTHLLVRYQNPPRSGKVRGGGLYPKNIERGKGPVCL